MIKRRGFVFAMLCSTATAGNAADYTQQSGETQATQGIQQDIPHKPLFRFSYNLSAISDDNIRRAQNDADIRSDLISSLTLSAKGGVTLSNLSLLNFGGSVTYEVFSTFSNLDNINFNLNARYRFAFSKGFSASVYSFGIKVGGIESELEIRDSTWFSSTLQMNKSLTSTISTAVGLSYKQRESTSEVFDTVDSRLFVNFDLNLSRAALIYGTYTFITGDVVSSATPSLQFINWSDAIEPDEAFGGIAFNQFAYRLDADTNVYTLGYNQIITRSISVDVSYRFVDTEAAGGIFYERQIFRASLLGRF